MKIVLNSIGSLVVLRFLRLALLLVLFVILLFGSLRIFSLV